MSKTIFLGYRLRYPITIEKILKRRGDAIKKREPIMQYSYKYKWSDIKGDATEEDTGEEELTTNTVYWDSPADGEVREWRIKEGDIIKRDQECLIVREACSHEIQYQGLCAICGKDMTEVNWASEQRDTERAPINMTHDQTSLTVSELQAARAEQELQRRLLNQRKLSLVVDLDQTIIHACIEPTIGEWQSDPTNPNYESVKEVKRFQLNDDGPRGLASGCWYYIKLRPGLTDFLQKIAESYELHVYTMGTRAYAKSIAELVDPDQKLFGNRVISRDENGSMIAKSLQRLFPVSTNMVVIIDDRADVWPRNRPNLIKVTPYDFFKGIGDINSSFLPKRQDLLAIPRAQEATPRKDGASDPDSSEVSKVVSTTSNGTSKVSALEELAGMSSGDDAALRRMQTEEQERSLEKQITDRPLLHLQEKLDKEDEEAGRITEPQNGDKRSSPPPHQRHQVLQDDDDELSYLEKHLTALHQAYYEEYDNSTSVSANPVIPDVGRVLDRLKSKVLEGTTIVLSGIVPLGVDIMRTEIGLQATSYGAQIQTRISRRVTHLVISSARPRTQKARQAAKFPNIKIVNQDWLSDSLSRWTKMNETPYMVGIHPADRVEGNSSTGPSTDNTDAETLSDAESEYGALPRRPPRTKIKKPSLRITDETGRQVGRGDPDTDGEGEGHEDGDDDLDNEEGLIPDEPADGELSPVDGLKEFNWDVVDEEYNEWMAGTSDDDEEDEDDEQLAEEPKGDNTDIQQSLSTATRTKRKHATDDEAGDTASEGSRGRGRKSESALAKKQRLVRVRASSGLRTVRTPDASGDSGNLPTPQITGDEDDAKLPKAGVGKLPVELFEIDEDDLLAELEAEEAEKG